MENTYTPMSKVKTVQQKQSTVAWAGKGNKKNLPVKNKTNLVTNRKTKIKQGSKWGLKQWKQN